MSCSRLARMRVGVRLGRGMGSDEWSQKQKGLGWRSLKIKECGAEAQWVG